MKLLLFGAPGSGKGTQAEAIRRRWRIPQVSTGDILRAEVKAGTDLGRQARTYMDRGELVPDDVMVGIIRRRLAEPDCAEGFMLDGFPRTRVQAEALDRMMAEAGLAFDAVLYLDVPREELIRRLSGRLTCPTCGRTYHPDSNPPAPGNRCPVDGTELVQRPDDTVETATNRVEVFLRDTMPVLDHYRRAGIVHDIDGTGGIEEVGGRVMKVLEGIG